MQNATHADNSRRGRQCQYAEGQYAEGQYAEGQYAEGRSEGFTLLELIVVITIIGILASAVVFSVAGWDEKAKVTRVKADFNAIKTAASMFKSEHGRYPESLQELENPPATRDGRQPTFLENAPKDPWTFEYYNFERLQNGKIHLWSFGQDMAQGGTGFDEDIDSENLQGGQ